ncbi:MAG: hypothetical protein HND52_12290 [Ignavibacteriae bacterium]|nr:hypothetical protein [Ignavibacteriota bacterium]NOG98732.1 hypothetical protein [Ignavibacteriota bacterium]
MFKILFAFLFLVSQSSAQDQFILKDSLIISYMNFLPETNNLVTLAEKRFIHKSLDSTYSKNFIWILSYKDGNRIQEIELPDGNPRLFGLYFSNDGASIVITTASYDAEGFYSSYGKFRFSWPKLRFKTKTISKYLIKENRWAWELDWLLNYECLQLTFNDNDDNIIAVTTRNIVKMDAMTGEVIENRNSISSFFDFSETDYNFKLSRTGRYFAFWKREIIVEGEGCCGAINLIWYFSKWLINFGSIPNSLIIWDIEKDKLHYQIDIPYEMQSGVPEFSFDEKELIFGPIDNIFEIVDLKKKEKSRAIIYYEREIYDNLYDDYYSLDMKYISQNNKYLITDVNSHNIILMDYETGDLIKIFENLGYGLSKRDYPVSLSLDNKFLAIVLRKNKLVLFETMNFTVIWEKVFMPEKE